MTLNILVLLTIYIPASFNPTGVACISTNIYGEHWIEFLYIAVGFVTFLDFVARNYSYRKKENKEKNEESARLHSQQKAEN